jgi:hypothetical protein
MTSNSAVLIDREIANGAIEGVYFGPKLWVIARSPAAVLIWVFGHSWSVNGHQSYAQPHLTLLPDRSPRFLSQPKYRSLRRDWTRLTDFRLLELEDQIAPSFPDQVNEIAIAVRLKKTAILEGGGGALLPLKCHGEAYADWKRNGGGFIVRPEGMTEHEMLRGKLGWKQQ